MYNQYLPINGSLKLGAVLHCPFVPVILVSKSHREALEKAKQEQSKNKAFMLIFWSEQRIHMWGKFLYDHDDVNESFVFQTVLCY